jgi:hypothetical protein
MSITDIVLIGWTSVVDWMENLIPLIQLGIEG